MRTYGGRPLVSYAISTRKPRDSMRLKPHERPLLTRRPRLISAQPAVLHMMYSIHGNEPSGANSTPLVAYYTAAQMMSCLSNSRTSSSFSTQCSTLTALIGVPTGATPIEVNPSFDANDREHAQSVPNGRTSYYWFDLTLTSYRINIRRAEDD